MSKAGFTQVQMSWRKRWLWYIKPTLQLPWSLPTAFVLAISDSIKMYINTYRKAKK